MFFLFKKRIYEFFTVQSISRIMIFKLIFRIILFQPIYYFFSFLSYIGLLIHYNIFIFFNNIFFNIMYYFDFRLKDEKNSSINNLIQIMGFLPNDKKLEKISKESLKIEFLEYQKNKYFFKFFGIKNFLKYSNKMKIINRTSLDLKNLNKSQKIIFCHAHSNNKYASITKIGLFLDKNLNMLFIHRHLPPEILNFFLNMSKHEGRPEPKSFDAYFEENKLGLIKKISKADIIHIYVDLPIHKVLKNFSSTNIMLFDKEATVINGVARIAFLTNAICIPVFVNGNEVNLLEEINICEFNSRDESILMQRIFDSLSEFYIKYPGQFALLSVLHQFFRNVKFRE